MIKVLNFNAVENTIFLATGTASFPERCLWLWPFWRGNWGLEEPNASCVAKLWPWVSLGLAGSCWIPIFPWHCSLVPLHEDIFRHLQGVWFATHSICLPSGFEEALILTLISILRQWKCRKLVACSMQWFSTRTGIRVEFYVPRNKVNAILIINTTSSKCKKCTGLLSK